MLELDENNDLNEIHSNILILLLINYKHLNDQKGIVEKEERNEIEGYLVKEDYRVYKVSHDLNDQYDQKGKNENDLIMHFLQKQKRLA